MILAHMRNLTVVVLLALIISLAGCSKSKNLNGSLAANQERETVFQVSLINFLLQGGYDGVITCGELKKHGDLGIGTLDELDGEMVVIDGQILQIKADGSVNEVKDKVKSPFATLTYFDADQKQELRGITSLEHLQDRLDEMINKKNIFYAIRIDGTFEHAKARSVPKQTKPYRPLMEVTKTQPTFEFNDVKGTLVGFWCPEYVQGINVSGYHLHFITEDRRQGGHLLECSIQEGTAQIDSTTGFYMVLPAGGDFSHADLTKDRKSEIEKVEK